MDLKENIISVENLSKVFKTAETSKNRKAQPFYALKDISFNIYPNKTIGIIGKNGSGKSTLLKILANIISPSSGQVTINGKVASVLKIGAGFHPDLTGRENIFFYGALLGMRESDIREKFEQIVSFSELEPFIDEPVKNYSDGMYLRLAFSVVVHTNVDIILFDEVLTVGDSSFNIKSFSKIRELKKRKTIILVSHNMDDIVKICDECIWINEGEIKFKGNPSTVVSLYMESNWLTSKVQKLSNNTNHYHYQLMEKNVDNTIQLKYIDIKENSKEKIAEGISYNNGFQIDIMICVSKDYLEGLLPSIVLFNQNDMPIALSSTAFDNKSRLNISRKGNYRIKCNFPLQFLNIGIYKIYFYLFDHLDNAVYRNNQPVSFRIICEESLQSESLIKSSFSISPAFNWSIEEE